MYKMNKLVKFKKFYSVPFFSKVKFRRILRSKICEIYLYPKKVKFPLLNLKSEKMSLNK